MLSGNRRFIHTEITDSTSDPNFFNSGRNQLLCKVTKLNLDEL